MPGKDTLRVRGASVRDALFTFASVETEGLPGTGHVEFTKFHFCCHLSARKTSTPADGVTRNKRRRRLLIWISIFLSGVLIAFLGAVAIYIYPPPGDSSGADLIYVIGPPTPKRMAEAEELRRETGAALLISVAPADRLYGYHTGDLPVCDEPDVTCSAADPFTTSGEALLLQAYARTHSVRKVAVVTFTPHVSRTRYIFSRCSQGLDIDVVGVDEGLSANDWAYQFAYQTGAFFKAVAAPCASP